MAKPDKNVLEIRLDHLEEDAALQPQLMFEWGTLLAKARKATKEAKNRMKLVEAKAKQMIRADPEAFSVSKLTEGALEEVLLQRSDYQAAYAEHVQAEYEEDVLDLFVKSIQDRKEQIGNEVKLFVGMYYAKPDNTAKTVASNIRSPKKHG